MAINFDIEEKKFPMVLHVRKGQQSVLNWRLPSLAGTKEKEESSFHKVRWNAQNNSWEMQYGDAQGMPNTPWNFAIMELDIYPIDQDEPLSGAKVQSVSDSISVIQPEGSLDISTAYRAKIRETSPSQLINIFQKGSEREIQRFEELYRPLASPYLQFVNTETIADYILELKSDEWLLLEPDENAPDGLQLIFGVEKMLEDWAINELMKNLSKIVRWRQMLTMYNPNTSFEQDEVAFSVKRLGPKGEAVETFETPNVVIELEKFNNAYDSVGTMITAENRGKRNLYLHPLYFSRFFEIQSLEAIELYPGGQEVKVFSGGLTIPDPDLVEVLDIFKIIASDKAIDTSGFDQEKIDLGRVTGPARSLTREATRRLPSWPTGMEWMEKTFTIRLQAMPPIQETYTQTAQEPPIQQQQEQAYTAEIPDPMGRLRDWQAVRELISKGKTEMALLSSRDLAEKYNRKELWERLAQLRARWEKLQDDLAKRWESLQDGSESKPISMEEALFEDEEILQELLSYMAEDEATV